MWEKHSTALLDKFSVQNEDDHSIFFSCSPNKKSKGHWPYFAPRKRLQGLSNPLLTSLFGLFLHIFGLIKIGLALSGILLLQIW